MINVKYFGNGRQVINSDYYHAIKTKEYHNLKTRDGCRVLPAEKMYVAVDFIDAIDGSFARIRIDADTYTDISIKSIDYVDQLKRNPNIP